MHWSSCVFALIFVLPFCYAGRDNVYYTKCIRQPPEYCKLNYVTGPCKAAMPRFYYNVKKGCCEHFTYGGCGGNKNNFETIKECENTCIRRSCKDYKGCEDVGCAKAFSEKYDDGSYDSVNLIICKCFP